MRQITDNPAPARGVMMAVGTWLVLAVSALGAGGCQDATSLTPIQDVAEFNREVNQSNLPVLADFYKEGCPTCILQDGVLDDLAREYQGRVKFLKFKVREPTFVSPCPEFMDEHKLFWVPTAVLFVNGKEQKRWELNHMAGEFCEALDAACARPPNQPGIPQTTAP